MWESYYSPVTLTDALELLKLYGSRARIVAGGTDLILEIEGGARSPSTLIDLSRIPGLDTIRLGEDGQIHLGPNVTHNHVIGSELCVERAFPLAQACSTVGSAQLRNQATVVGNLVTASPANDTIAPLLALDACLTLESAARGCRTVALGEFYRGVRQTALEPDELVTAVSFEPLAENERGIFLKLGLQQAMAIAVVNVAAVLAFDGPRVTRARLALGSVAPTVIRAPEAEEALKGQRLDEDVIARAAERAAAAARPIDDIRGSADYRRRMVALLTRRALLALREGSERSGWLPALPRLWGETEGHFRPRGGAVAFTAGDTSQPIEMTINGQAYAIQGAANTTLLHLVREKAGLTGTKEGCGEGECGSCTLLLDGIAVLSCLLPAPRAHGARITTVEGLAQDGQLTPLQQAFIEEGAVQCGYCTPGFLMAGHALLAERPHPSPAEIRQSLVGNLCRCTGYYKIIRAVERAAGGAAEEPAPLGEVRP